MDKFVSLSNQSIDALKIIKMSSKLPVNILIYGQTGVGKKLLASEVFRDVQIFDSAKLEYLINNKSIDLKQFSILIIHDIQNVVNKKYFFEKIKKIKLIATSCEDYSDSLNAFSVKVNIEPLSSRNDDLEYLKRWYIKKASNVYKKEIKEDEIKIDISKNGTSLKHSIYKNSLLNYLEQDEIEQILYNFFKKEFKAKNTSYKKIMELFEITFLKASKDVYKSQLQISNKLNINRMTLRKKIEKYFGSNNEW